MRTKYLSIKPHETTDSNKLNFMQQSIAEDIADLYKSYIGIKNDIEVHNLIVPTKADNLESSITALENQLNSMATNTALFTMYDTSSVRYPSSVANTFRCRHEHLYGEVVLPIANTYVEYHYIDPTTGDRSIITNIDSYVKSFLTNNRYKPKINEIYENSPINAINQISSKMHLVKTLTNNSDINDVDLVYNLDSQETRLFNTLRVFPLPELLVSYKAVNLSGPAKTQATITDWAGTELVFLDDNDVPLEKARKKTFRFPDEDINSISIVLNTDIYKTSDGITREFMIGARLISLEHNTYMAEGYIGIEIDATGRSVVEQIVPVYEGEPSNIEVFVFRTEGEFNDNTGHVLNGTATSIQTKPALNIGTREKIYILFKLIKHDNNTTPTLKGCVIKWAQ